MDKLLLKPIKYIFQNIINQRVILKIAFVLFIIAQLSSCASIKFNKTKTQINTEFKNSQLSTQFTGLLVVDVDSKDTIFTKNATKYFIPASTVKLFTLYAANTLLNDRIPTIKYKETKDSIYLIGTGDPTWLHPYFKDSTAIEFIANTKKTISLNLNNFEDEKYRPGWAWEDYQYYFSPELNPIPLYGNVVNIYESDSLIVSPGYFRNTIQRTKSDKLRNIDNNHFYVPLALKDTLNIPFITSDELTGHLLEQKLNRKVILSKNTNYNINRVLYGIATDSIYKRMLYKSDNFLAEQLMLVASSTLSDTISFNRTKDYILENHLSGLRQEPRWVDGSGLSRYNLFTPESMVVVLEKLYAQVDKKRLFKLLPRWNSNGTIQKTVSENDRYIYAKSGSIGNTYNLCGYLRTKSGKLFVFSYMNNHFRIPSKQVRLQIEKTLKLIHDAH